MDKISVVIPCHNDVKIIRKIYMDVVRELKKLPISYELLFIDNASKDNSTSILRLLSEQDYACHYVSLNHRLHLYLRFFLAHSYPTGICLCLWIAAIRLT